MSQKNIQNRLIQALQNGYAHEWTLTTLDGNKRPYRPNWQNEKPLEREYITKAIRFGELVTYTRDNNQTYTVRKYPLGLGLRTGEISNGVLAIDFDGRSALAYFQEHFGSLPITAAFTSRKVQNTGNREQGTGNSEIGLPERFQIILAIAPEHWEGLKNRLVLKTGEDAQGKPEQLELRWNNCQSVLPGSVHPETGLYSWVPGRSYKETGIAKAPDAIIELLKEVPVTNSIEELSLPTEIEGVQEHTPLQKSEVSSQQQTKANVAACPIPCSWSDLHWAAYYLSRLSSHRADDYDSWLNVGMAAASSGDDTLLSVWETWSQQSAKYKPGCCAKKWRSFKRSGYTLASIFEWAKQDNVPHPMKAEFERYVTDCYQQYYEKRIDEYELNRLLWPARQAFWTWRQKDDLWQDLVSEVISRLPGECPINKEEDIIFGVSDFFGGGKKSKKQKAKTKSQGNSEKPGSTNPVLLTQIDLVLDQNLPESTQDLALVELAKNLDNYNAAEIRSAAEKRTEERLWEDTLKERKQDLEHLERLENENYLPFDDLFYAAPETAEAFKHLCRNNPKIQPQYLLSILSIASSLIGIKGEVEVPVLGKHRGTINTVMVGESGEGKSIVSGILLKPLYELQEKRIEEHHRQKGEYLEAVQLWEKTHPDERGPKPKEKDYITVSDAFLTINEYSREGIVKNHAEHPNGLLIHQEELIAIQRAQNMYRQGKGDDRQFINNLYDNKPIYRALAKERISVKETAVSITGGMQPMVMIAEMGDMTDPDGQWARYNMIMGRERKIYTDLDMPTVDVSDILFNLYHKCYFSPAVSCRIEREGIKLLQKFINKTEDLRWSTLAAGKRAVLSKAGSEVVRIALNLHWMNCLLSGNAVSENIPAIAIERAIAIKEFFLRQIDIVHSWGQMSGDSEEGLAPMYRSIQKLCMRMKGVNEVLTPRMVLAAKLPGLKNFRSKAILKLFKDFVAMGKAVLVNCKRSVGLLISSVIEADSNSSNSNAPSSDNPTINNEGSNSGNWAPHSSNSNSPPAVVSLSELNNNSNKNNDSLINSQLLETAGDLLKDLEKEKVSNTNGLTSFAEIVETVEKVELDRDNIPLCTPTSSAVSSNSETQSAYTSAELDHIAAIQQKVEEVKPEQKVDGFKKGDRIKNQITGKEGIITGFSSGDRTASISLANGETTRWYLYCLEKVVETDSSNQGLEITETGTSSSNSGARNAADQSITDEDIQNIVSILFELPSCPEFIEFLALLPSSFINAAWDYIKQIRGSQVMNVLYQSIKALFADSESIWGTSECSI